MLFGKNNSDPEDFFSFDDDEDLLSPDPSNRTESSAFLKLYTPADLFSFFDHYGLSFIFLNFYLSKEFSTRFSKKELIRILSNSEWIPEILFINCISI